MNNADPKDVQDMYVETFEEGARKAADKAALESNYNMLVGITEAAIRMRDTRHKVMEYLRCAGVTRESLALLAQQRPDLYKWLSQK